MKTLAEESPNLIKVSLPLLSSSHFIIKTPILSYCKDEVSRTQRSLRYELLNMQIFCKSFLQTCEFSQGTRGFPVEHMKQVNHWSVCKSQTGHVNECCGWWGGCLGQQVGPQRAHAGMLANCCQIFRFFNRILTFGYFNAKCMFSKFWQLIKKLNILRTKQKSLCP